MMSTYSTYEVPGYHSFAFAREKGRAVTDDKTFWKRKSHAQLMRVLYVYYIPCCVRHCRVISIRYNSTSKTFEISAILSMSTLRRHIKDVCRWCTFRDVVKSL